MAGHANGCRRSVSIFQQGKINLLSEAVVKSQTTKRGRSQQIVFFLIGWVAEWFKAPVLKSLLKGTKNAEDLQCFPMQT